MAGTAIVTVLGESGLNDQLRWTLANTLTIVADRSNRNAIEALLETEANNDVADRLARALKDGCKAVENCCRRQPSHLPLDRVGLNDRFWAPSGHRADRS